MFVVVPIVGGMPASVMDVVDVIAVGNGDVAAAIAVSVIVPVMHAVAVGGFTFVKVIAVAPVQMTVVQIVDVITMRNRDMSATVAMRMVVPRVLPVRYRVHLFLLVIVERAGNVDMLGASAELSIGGRAVDTTIQSSTSHHGGQEQKVTENSWIECLRANGHRTPPASQQRRKISSGFRLGEDTAAFKHRHYICC
ncbi:hypothetical protein DSM43518_02200 [Mycobacterium marinum]|uniref:Uncharacterized protein n=1 Tax=Mycobacterium shottsii TaxID=133549 RepID=A0A7I7LM59_9MYCO|nr:hypothetical protein MM1218R_04816 [Mycobacterium marinum]EPQ73838.1 hypothetical protein MMEU_1498 [Mycobacterium marinum str. Europe]QYL30027.1 hypothetical protein TM48_04587 [Mycobacterium shottsii]CDM78768.1 hypothetical membrane protein [Mycobacterium marinum E11]AXN52156.1 hypothetical protein CCUG20998_04773 [Mycobacterium marinum]